MCSIRYIIELLSFVSVSGIMRLEFTKWFRPPKTLADVMQELQSHIPRDLVDAPGGAASLSSSPTRAASFPFQRAVAYELVHALHCRKGQNKIRTGRLGKGAQQLH